MHDRQALRETHTALASIRGTARAAGVSRNTVRRAVRAAGPDGYSRHSEIDDYAEAVADVLADYPHMTVADIGVIVDWKRSRRRLSDLVAKLRPAYIGQPDVEARPITSIRTGTLAQVGEMTIGRVGCEHTLGSSGGPA
ncbi:hypothetical protein [Brevibacterium sp.]|uniref:hypothetical protein n=1 Tax=Brevibacterium sp. TaxID=1701 RepID=UPI002811C62E|nr:hypothetical protein [Brevibacterium sp.]